MFIDHIWRAWYNDSDTMAAEPIETLELHYTMIQFFINSYTMSLISLQSISSAHLRVCIILFASNYFLLVPLVCLLFCFFVFFLVVAFFVRCSLFVNFVFVFIVDTGVPPVSHKWTRNHKNRMSCTGFFFFFGVVQFNNSSFW